ncbi:MAG: putative capsular polysaccharide synthesis family protein [Pseudomonadota bacterium]
MKTIKTLRKIKITHPLLALGMRALAKWETRRGVFSNSPPILIYQMGQVGSSTVYRTLREAKLPNPIYKVHFLSQDLHEHRKKHEKAGFIPPPYHFFIAEALQKFLSREPQVSCKIISLVRDPIAIEISGLFQNSFFVKNSLRTPTGSICPQKASRYLERKFKKVDKFQYINEWFDRELKSVFGIDVFATPFPVDKGYAIYEKTNIELLIIRLEALSDKGPRVLSKFIGLDKPLQLKQANRRKNTDDAEIYHKVLKSLCLEPSLCQQLYSSRYVQHFYDELMIKTFISRWTQNWHMSTSTSA